MLSFCTFLTFYLLLKVEDQNAEEHPVVYKLAHFKTLFEKLKHIDQKMEPQIQYVLSMADKQPTTLGLEKFDKEQQEEIEESEEDEYGSEEFVSNDEIEE